MPIPTRRRFSDPESGCPRCCGESAEVAARDAVTDAMAGWGVTFDKVADTFDTAAGQLFLEMCHDDAFLAALAQGGRLCGQCAADAAEAAEEDGRG